MLPDIRETFDRLVAEGIEAADAARTFEYRCNDCGTTTWLSREGGRLNDGACKPNCSPHALQVHVTLAGERESMGTMASTLGIGKRAWDEAIPT